jgi:hypothetical protein
MQEQELFQQYELKGWQISPRFYKIIGVSVLTNLVLFALMAQANFLTGKTCDSPVASGVCSVLDALYIGSQMGDYEYAREDYNPTKISEDDEIIMVNLDGEYPPLTYPAGYFALANPEQQTTITDIYNPAATGTTDFPGITNITPPITNDDLSKIKPTIPKANGNTVNGILPTNPFGDVNPTMPKKNGKGFRNKVNPTQNPTLEDVNGKTTAENKDKTTNNNTTSQENKTKPDTEDEGKFNKKPLEDFGVKYGVSILNKEINVNAPFTIEVVAKLDPNGKFIEPRVTAKSGDDEKMIAVAKEAIAAFGDTKLLKPLYDAGGRDVLIIFAQDADNLQAIIKTKTVSVERAKTLQSGLGLLIRNSSAFMKEGSDEATLIKRAQLGTEQNFFVINFLISNEEKTQLIDKSLKSLQEKLKNQSNSGVANIVGSNQKADK